MREQSGIPDLRAHLLTRVLPFWARHSIDHDHGGFVTHLARDGRITDGSHKFLVMQTRMIYSFITGADLGGPPEWRMAARQGVEFFLRRMRDVQYDGWLWSVTRQGSPADVEKRMYGHAFAIYALAEYARLARDDHALAAANHTWSLAGEYLWDRDHEGVFEVCNRDWRPTERRHTMGTHLHTLEALLALNEALRGDQYLPHVGKIADLIANRMVEPEHRCGIESFLEDWTPDPERNQGLVNYGHNLEAAWLLLRVYRLAPSPEHRQVAREFLDYVVRFGLDTEHGGIFSHGPLGKAASVRRKIWWVQCEALPAFLLGYLTFGEESYWEAFRSTVDFCLRYLHDDKHGEWYHSTDENGAPRDTAKGSAWKAAYHITQACAYAHHYLEEIERGSG